ncbi:hypothetical protein ACP4OV_019196 [Aristida adscensionis]
MAPTVMASSATSVAPFQGLKSTAGLPVGRRSAAVRTVSNGGRIRCMQVWPAYGNKKFETLSYLPPLSVEGFQKQVEYLIRSNWVPCIEFSKVGFVYRENATSPGYYDGRYWTMWKLCTGPCGSCPCSAAPTPARCSRSSRRPRRPTPTATSGSSDSTT